jgi:hypothetical protein
LCSPTGIANIDPLVAALLVKQQGVERFAISEMPVASLATMGPALDVPFNHAARFLVRAGADLILGELSPTPRQPATPNFIQPVLKASSRCTSHSKLLRSDFTLLPGFRDLLPTKGRTNACSRPWEQFR